MHIVHGPKGVFSVLKAVGHCVRMRTWPAEREGPILGSKDHWKKHNLHNFLNFFVTLLYGPTSPKIKGKVCHSLPFGIVTITVYSQRVEYVSG